MTSDRTISRRHFLVAGASGLTIGVALQSLPGLRGVAGALPAQPATDATAAAATVATAADLNAYIHIAPDNTITVKYGGGEFGHGTMKSLAQISAEEWRVPWTSVTVAQADADPNVSFVTFGSSAVMSQFLPLATAG